MSKSDEELDREVEEALACPCVADLRDGACGEAFVNSFSCFIKSKEEEKGMDCLESFQALQVYTRSQGPKGKASCQESAGVVCHRKYLLECGNPSHIVSY